MAGPVELSSFFETLRTVFIVTGILGALEVIALIVLAAWLGPDWLDGDCQ